MPTLAYNSLPVIFARNAAPACAFLKRIVRQTDKLARAPFRSIGKPWCKTRTPLLKAMAFVWILGKRSLRDRLSENNRRVDELRLVLFRDREFSLGRNFLDLGWSFLLVQGAIQVIEYHGVAGALQTSADQAKYHEGTG